VKPAFRRTTNNRCHHTGLRPALTPPGSASLRNFGAVMASAEDQHLPVAVADAIRE